jgi:hypothetical protein
MPRYQAEYLGGKISYITKRKDSIRFHGRSFLPHVFILIAVKAACFTIVPLRFLCGASSSRFRGSYKVHTLDRIEALLRTSTRSPQTPPAQGSSWAKVAVLGTRHAGVPEAILPTRHTVRVQMTQAKGMANEEILKEVRKTISGAAAIRVLRSGDIDVTVPDEAAKDRAHGLPSTETLKIFKRDYLVEVPSVPLSVRVACEKGADNARLANTDCEASRTLSPGLQITRIRWLHNQARQEQQAQ